MSIRLANVIARANLVMRAEPDSPIIIAPTPVAGFSIDHGVVPYLVGGKLSQWDNRIGANNLVQASAGHRALYVLDGAHYCARFTEADFTVMTAAVLPLNGDYTVFQVRKFRNPKPSGGASWSNSFNGVTDGMCDADSWAAGQVSLGHIFVTEATWGAGTANLEKVVYRYDFASALARVQLNGVDLGNQALAHQNAPTGALRLGAKFDNGVSGSDVDQYEWWAWDRRITDAEVAGLDNFGWMAYAIP